MYFDVGLVSMKKLYIENSSESMLLDNFYRDCEALNIDVYSGDWLGFVPEHKGAIIMMFRDWDIRTTYDYHFVKVNIDRILSHKNVHNGEISPL